MKACYRGTWVLNETPHVAMVDDVLTAEECRRFVELARESLAPAKVSLDKEAAVVDGRTGSNTWLGYDRYPEARAVGEKVSELVGIPLEFAEAIQVVHYGVEQKYGAHFDAYDLATEKGRRCCKWGGQRLVTCLIYLNEVPEGGGTRFPQLDLEVSPKQGRMLIFHNVDGEDFSKPHPLSLHGGEPVTEGEKWAMNIWFHQASMKVPFDIDQVRPAEPLQPWYSNRAIELFGKAFDMLKPSLPKDAPIFCYWDTYFGPEPDALATYNGRVARLVDRRVSNRLANKGVLPAMLSEAKVAHLAPLSFDSAEDALSALPGDELFFVKKVAGTAGEGVQCVDRATLAELELESDQIVQEAVTDLRTYEGRKFTVRAYVLVHGEELYAYPDATVIAHGVPYDASSTDHAVQVDHTGYIEAGSPITMAPTADQEWGAEFSEAFRRFVDELAPVLEELRLACGEDTFSILGVDLLLTSEGELKLIEINAHPNFVHTPLINQAVNVPMLQHLMRAAIAGGSLVP